MNCKSNIKTGSILVEFDLGNQIYEFNIYYYCKYGISAPNRLADSDWDYHGRTEITSFSYVICSAKVFDDSLQMFVPAITPTFSKDEYEELYGFVFDKVEYEIS